MTTLAMRAVNVPRMTRVTWYKHRALMLGIPGLFLLAAALLVIDSVLQRHWVSSHHLTYCLTYANNDTSGTYANNDTSSRCLSATASSQLGVFGIFINYWRTEVPVVAVFALAAVAGLFAGVPWVAREFEGGGFRFTWTQSVSPLRWLFGTFGSLTLLAGVSAAICGVAAQWWFQVAQFRLNGGTTPWGWESVEMTPLSMVSWTLLAMALALLLGVTIRRTLPAMIAFAATFGGCAVLAQGWLPKLLFRIDTIPLRLRYGPGGPRLSPMTVYSQMYNPEHSVDDTHWLMQRHLSEWIAYQPHSHLIWLVLARNGILIAVAALAVLASVWWLRKHPAE
jgi:hypothetical protein